MIVYKTELVKPSDMKKRWLLIDAKGKTLGRLASKISNILQGKNKVDYVPYWDNGDNVIVINAKFIHVTGNKMNDKIYYKHTGYPGGIKQINYEHLLAKHPEAPLRIAVKGMLPHNKMGNKLLANLKIYPGDKHPHAAQNPEVYKVD